MALPEIRVGTSGWDYRHWRGLFYPDDLPRNQWLAYFQTRFTTVELNASFYRVSRPSTYARWRQASPDGFFWAVKAHRGITHHARLKERELLEKFLASVEELKDSLAVILFQLPPSLKFDEGVTGRFLSWLPKGMRYAIEPRHDTWFERRPLQLLQEHGVALCMADSGGRYPSAEELTAEFVYLRLHGSEQLYASRYSEEQIRSWAEKLTAWKRPGFVYFNNDFHGYAVENAVELKKKLAGFASEKGMTENVLEATQPGGRRRVASDR
jgi:uncharacterized protein YecE (DUF72 family)